MTKFGYFGFSRRKRVTLYATLLALSGWVGFAAEPAKLPLPQKPSELFVTTNVWTVHLKFTPDQWEAIEPKGGGNMFGGPRGGGGPGGPGGGPGGRGPGGPGGRGPGGPGGGPGGFGPAMFLAPMFVKEGDKNDDQKLSKAEFAALGEKWFTAWDKEKSGKLTADNFRDGLNATMGGGGGPGGGRGGGGMNLQGAEGKRNGLASSAGVEFNYVHADLDFNGQPLKDVAVRYKGNGTWMQSRGSMKHSLKVDLNHFSKDQKFAGVTRLNLHNAVTDASWMNEVLSYRLYRDAGIPASRTAYARVYVTVPGKFEKQYLGLYSIVEDFDNHMAQEVFATKKGAIFKPVTADLFGDLGNDWKKYNQTFDPKTSLTEAQKKRVIEFCKLVAHATDAEFAAKLGDYVDLEEFSRYMAVTVWLSTMDSILAMGQNFYVYLDPKTQKLKFVPWDLDHSFGQFGMMGSQEQREKLSIQHPWRGNIRFLERVFKVEAFKKPYLARLAEYNGTVFKPERITKQVDEVAAAIRPAVQEESKAKLKRFDKVVAGQAVQPTGFGGGDVPDEDEAPAGGPGPGGPGGPGGFRMQPSKPIKGFFVARSQAVAEQIAGKSKGENLDEMGGPGGRGGPGGPGGGPGNFIGPAFLKALDANQDGTVTHEEFTKGFSTLFGNWNADKSGTLSDEQLRGGINKDLSPFGAGGPPGGGPPR